MELIYDAFQRSREALRRERRGTVAGYLIDLGVMHVREASIGVNPKRVSSRSCVSAS